MTGSGPRDDRATPAGDQFAELGPAYEEFSAAPFRRYLEVPSVLAAVGDVHGRAVFDLGCGAGDYARWLRQQGAARVVGYDLSVGMVAHARERERRSPAGVEYRTEPPTDLDGVFDVALSVYVMPYAASVAELRDLCALAARVLRPGGRFVTLPLHPDFRADDPDYYAPYGFRLEAPHGCPLADGAPVRLRLAAAAQEEIHARYWSRGTLERVLADTGFTQVQWEEFQVIRAGIAAYGAEVWQPYLRCPHAGLLTCRRGEMASEASVVPR